MTPSTVQVLMVKEVPLGVGEPILPILCSRDEQDTDAFWVGVGMG